LFEGDERLRRLRHSCSLREYIEAVVLNFPEGFEIDGAHDFGGHESPAILRRTRVKRSAVKVVRALTLK
jgi:hypothetical protein